MVNGGVSQPLGISENTDTLVRQQAYHPHEPLKQTNSMPHVHVHLFFQEAYTFWICSTHLPMWLLNSDNKNSVKVEACQSTCLTVEKQCPFLIKGTEDDMASGNPSFMCKGKTHSKNSWNWCMIQNIAVCASGVHANFGGIFLVKLQKVSQLSGPVHLSYGGKRVILFLIKGNREEDMCKR